MAVDADAIDLATPDDVVVEQDPVVEDPATTDPDPAADEPYLAVNDRTTYKTKDDAIRGYNEAASRIAQLSGWEKQAKQYGLSDPNQLKAVADELLALREFKADQAKKAGIQNKTVDPADPKAKEAEQVRKYLKENGFISKDEQTEALQELRDQIAEMRNGSQRSQEVYFQNQEEEARDTVGSYMATEGIKDDGSGTKLAVLGTLIKDWINNSDERVDRWSRGGMSAKNLVKEGFDLMTKAVGWNKPAAAGVTLKPTDPGYAAAKAKAAAANKGKLPAPGTAKHGDPKAGTPKQKGHINASLHEKAWAAFEEANR